MTTPWERRENETNKAYDVFCVYRDMGAQRSLAKATQALGKPAGYVGQLERWSSQHDWVARAEAYDAHLRQQHEAVLRQEFEEDRKQARAIRQETVKELQTLLAAVITSYTDGVIDPKELNYLSNAAKSILDQSRQEFNDLPTHRQEITGRDGESLQVEHNVDAVIAALRKAQDDLTSND